MAAHNKFETYGMRTQRAQFLGQIDRLPPWAE
jgi:hypothetical protein